MVKLLLLYYVLFLHMYLFQKKSLNEIISNTYFNNLERNPFQTLLV